MCVQRFLAPLFGAKYNFFAVADISWARAYYNMNAFEKSTSARYNSFISKDLISVGNA